MTVELQMLVAAALLAVVQAFPFLFAVMLRGGLGVAAGNRAELPELPAWAYRAELAAEQAGGTNAETASGATLFFWARLAYAVIYIAGIPYLRTVAFVASLFGLFDVASVLLGAWGGTVPAGSS